MKQLSFLGASALLLMSGAAQAEATGSWRVNGAISGRAFVLDCRFDGRGGVCVDAESGKRSHTLASYAATGDNVAWSFKTKAMMMTITLSFAGRIAGNRMSGTMRAAGRNGTFTGVRN